MVITTDNLVKIYNTRHVVDGVSISVEQGSVVGLLGPNGAGKSSLLKCLGGLYRISEGQVFLEGVPLASMKKRYIARRIAWVHQSGSEALPFTVREFAAMSRYPWQKTLGCESKEDREIIKQALLTSGVEKIADRELNSLSGGERQKALIAAAHYNAQHLALLGQVGIIVEMYVAHLKEPAAAGFAVAVAGQGVQHACHEGGPHETLIFAEGVQ